MNIKSYLAGAGLLAATLPALAAPATAPSVGAGHGADAAIILAQGGGGGGGGPPPDARPGQGRGQGGGGGPPGLQRGGGPDGGGPAMQRGRGGPGDGGAAAQRGGGGEGAVIQRRGGEAPAVRGRTDFRGGTDVRVRSGVEVRERWRGDRWRYRYRDRGPRFGLYIAGGRGWCHRHHWRWRVLRHCHPYRYKWHRHGRWR